MWGAQSVQSVKLKRRKGEGQKSKDFFYFFFRAFFIIFFGPETKESEFVQFVFPVTKLDFLWPDILCISI